MVVDEVVAEDEKDPFYQKFDFDGIASIKDVYTFLKEGFVDNLYDEDAVVGDKSTLVGLPR